MFFVIKSGFIQGGCVCEMDKRKINLQLKTPQVLILEAYTSSLSSSHLFTYQRNTFEEALKRPAYGYLFMTERYIPKQLVSSFKFIH